MDLRQRMQLTGFSQRKHIFAATHAFSERTYIFDHFRIFSCITSGHPLRQLRRDTFFVSSPVKVPLHGTGVGPGPARVKYSTKSCVARPDLLAKRDILKSCGDYLSRWRFCSVVSSTCAMFRIITLIQSLSAETVEKSLPDM